MGSDLYKIKVAEKQGRTVKFKVEVVHPDSNYLSDGLSFALMVLYEGIPRDQGATCALGKEISFDDTLDRGWLELYTKGFIESTATKIESGSSDGQEKKDWIKGELAVTVTDAAWIEHLTVGAEFDSRAFDQASNFQDCKPIHPGQVDPNAPVPEAFMSIPGTLWQDSGLPAVVRVAAFSSSAYRSPDMKKGTFSVADLKHLDGQVVLSQGQYDDSPRVGLLSLAGDQVRIFTVSDGSWGSSGGTPFEGSIGKAELIPGKRLGSRLKLSTMLSRLEPKLLSATVEGDSASFKIAVPPGNTSFDSVSDEQLIGGAMQLLLTPLFIQKDGIQKLLSPSPLAWTVEREVLRLFPAEERQMTTWTNNQSVPIGDTMPDAGSLARRLAKGFIAKGEIVSRPPSGSSDVDSMTEAQQREVLLKPWPELVFKVTPLHAVYLQHLSQKFEPLQAPTWFAEAEAWEGPPPLPATGPTEFGKKAPPPPQQPQSSTPTYSSSGSSQPAAKPPVLKIVGIVLAALVGLCLLCMIIGAITGGGK